MKTFLIATYYGKVFSIISPTGKYSIVYEKEYPKKNITNSVLALATLREDYRYAFLYVKRYLAQVLPFADLKILLDAVEKTIIE